ncbi:hypothetical protein DICVIV_12174 [Dictyocaulus viviparus]|uniref:Uncharacterized protein n=1 Tax=Dictyocaulus viviparus TaxID=29172 RepID=A0A0D8XHN1_DICVI|nr:hypothetical protein DICVIV_12174 [Dictyocaulus viviparus]
MSSLCFSNISCVCYHNPTDYPFYICKTHSEQKRLKSADATWTPPNLAADDGSRPDLTSSGDPFVLSSVAAYITIGVLIVAILFTVMVLVVVNRQRQTRREDSPRHQENAQEALLMQPTDDDRYLPSV